MALIIVFLDIVSNFWRISFFFLSPGLQCMLIIKADAVLCSRGTLNLEIFSQFTVSKAVYIDLWPRAYDLPTG